MPEMLEPESQEPNEQEYDYYREPEPDVHFIKVRENRFGYFLATVSFLIALLFVSAFLNGYHDSVSSLLLLLGVIAFGFVGTFFIQQGRFLNSGINTLEDRQVADPGEILTGEDTEERLQEDEEAKEADKEGLTQFEVLVEEALSSIPEEFREKMENVLVRVQDEPGEEVLERIGVKEGYTLLGLYEGVPLTAYGHARVPQPEIITIYQRTIEEYCHRDPDRIREQVRHTVLHEVAHHFGIDHDEMPIWVR
jgi:predicted Zn-dependent protease with MMP-like domain